MFLIDEATAAAGNQFTNGNPTLGVPATVVSDDWLNAIQNELANFIEGQGLTLNKADSTQLEAAIDLAIKAGGVSQSSDTIANNTASLTDVSGMIFDKTTVKAVRLMYDIHRQTDSTELDEVGEVYLTHKTVADTWHIDRKGSNDDSGVDLSVTSAGQVQYLSTNMSGANYSGTIRFTAINTLAV